MKWKLKVTLPWKNMHPRGLIEEADMSEKNRPPLQNCRPALLPSLISSFIHAMSFARRWLMFKFIMSWLVYSYCIYMEIRLLWLVSPSHLHQNLSHWPSACLTLENLGIRSRRLTGNIMSHILNPLS